MRLLFKGVSMHNNSTLLKEKLREIKKNNYKAPLDIEPFKLALAMMENIGSTDAELRDKLIYSTFCYWIDGNVFAEEQLEELLDISLDDRHLFYKIGENGEDSVFARTFSILIAALSIYAHRKHKFISEDKLKSVTEKAIRYMAEEKDLRGYVRDKGWAHSTAHGADALDELVQCSTISQEEVIKILEVIKAKVCVNEYAYISEEDERMAVPVVNVIKQNLLEESWIINWIKDFRNIKEIGKYPEDENITVNVKHFLRSLYFQLIDESNSTKVIETIKETLSQIK